jgi:DNA modification methylase
VTSQEIRLEWPGRTWRREGVTGSLFGGAPAVAEEAGEERATVIMGDALDVATMLHARGQRAHLVYVDPPYASQADYVAEARLDGVQGGRTRRTAAFGDRWRGPEGIGAYLEMLAPRLEAGARLLRDDGTLWVHLDWRSAYLVRTVLDEIFGREGFKNEIVWRRAPNLGRQAASGQFGRTLDTILVYGGENARIVPPTRLEPIDDGSVRIDEQQRAFTTAPRGDYTDASIEKLDLEGRVHRTSSGKVYIKYFLVKDSRGKFFRERRIDALWTDVSPLRHAKVSERTGYPTQKPLALLDRIVRCASPEGGLVVDLFCGSGTTAEAALAAGRHTIVADKSAVAIATTRARLLRAGMVPSISVIPPSKLPRGEARAVLEIDRARARIVLEEPSLPLAWAVDARGTSDVFRASWHAERTMGGSAEALPTVANVGAPESPIQVRAWGDDGTLFEATLAF